MISTQYPLPTSLKVSKSGIRGTKASNPLHKYGTSHKFMLHPVQHSAQPHASLHPPHPYSFLPHHSLIPYHPPVSRHSNQPYPFTLHIWDTFPLFSTNCTSHKSKPSILYKFSHQQDSSLGKIYTSINGLPISSAFSESPALSNSS